MQNGDKVTSDMQKVVKSMKNLPASQITQHNIEQPFFKCLN
jgi:hypothetical protein